MASATRRFLLEAVGLIGLTGLVYAGEQATKDPPHPPIPVHFHLDRPGFVTLVVEHEHGMRVRNLVSETYFPAGDQVALWDCLFDHERYTNSPEQSV
jgi:hypothetical protein